MPPEPLVEQLVVRLDHQVGNPAWAETWAMPEPMRPQPITPTFLDCHAIASASSFLTWSWNATAAERFALAAAAGKRP